MTEFELMSEYNMYRSHRIDNYQEAIKITRMVIVNILGLNAVATINEDGTQKDQSKMSEEERQQFMPLVYWIAHPEILKKLGNAGSAEDMVEKALNDKEYEDMVSTNMDLLDDIEPIIPAALLTKDQIRRLKLESPETKASLERLGVKKGPIAPPDDSGSSPTRRKIKVQ